jgi:hypothetical protein
MAASVRKHFPELDETEKVHMKKQCQGVWSTKIKEENVTDKTIPELGTHQNVSSTSLNAQLYQNKASRKHPPKSKKMNDVYIKIHKVSETMHNDQTGRFPATSSWGNQCIMVLVEVDGKYIDAEPMKNKTEGSIIKAYLALRARLTALGTVRPMTHILDNKALAAY